MAVLVGHRLGSALKANLDHVLFEYAEECWQRPLLTWIANARKSAAVSRFVHSAVWRVVPLHAYPLEDRDIRKVFSALSRSDKMASVHYTMEERRSALVNRVYGRIHELSGSEPDLGLALTATFTSLLNRFSLLRVALLGRRDARRWGKLF